MIVGTYSLLLVSVFNIAVFMIVLCKIICFILMIMYVHNIM